MNQKTNLSSNKNPYTIWFVVFAFVAPAVLAYVMYFFGDIRSFTNHGEILNPVVDISTLKLKDDKNNADTQEDTDVQMENDIVCRCDL